MKQILWTILILTSCSIARANTNDTFIHLISKLRVIETPFYYDLVKQDDENCYHIVNNEVSLFNDLTVSILGLLPDTTTTYKILYLQPGDDLYPSLLTFTKTGKVVDNHVVCYNLCAGWDCSMDSCESTLKIVDDWTIERYLKVVNTDCDDKGKKISNTTKTEIYRQKISVDKDGKISFGKEVIK